MTSNYILRVNTLSREDYAKFIVSEQGGELVFDSLGQEEVIGELRHKQITEVQGIAGLVLGGGDLYFRKSEGVSLTGESTDYGQVHEKILRGFLPLIRSAYEERGISVVKTEADGAAMVNEMVTPKRVIEYIEALS